jgi:hypothetical protein
MKDPDGIRVELVQTRLRSDGTSLTGPALSISNQEGD